MAAKTMSNIKVETEGDLQIVYFTLSSVADNDTVDISGFFKNIVMFEAVPDSSAGTGFTQSSGVVTIRVSSGTPKLTCRAAGN